MRRPSSSALTVCNQPGCHELVTGGYCEAHHRERRQTSDARRPNATDRGYDSKWRRTRGRYLKHHPICEQPGCTTASVEVHHLDGLGPLGTDGHKWHNLEALCKTHHGQRTAHDQPAGWNAR